MGVEEGIKRGEGRGLGLVIEQEGNRRQERGEVSRSGASNFNPDDYEEEEVRMSAEAAARGDTTKGRALYEFIASDDDEVSG